VFVASVLYWWWRSSCHTSYIEYILCLFSNFATCMPMQFYSTCVLLFYSKEEWDSLSLFLLFIISYLPLVSCIILYIFLITSFYRSFVLAGNIDLTKPHFDTLSRCFYFFPLPSLIFFLHLNTWNANLMDAVVLHCSVRKWNKWHPVWRTSLNVILQ